jgi:hypothetical protein
MWYVCTSCVQVTPRNASQSQTVPLNLIFMNKSNLSEIPVSPLWYVEAQFMQVFVCRSGVYHSLNIIAT